MQNKVFAVLIATVVGGYLLRRQGCAGVPQTRRCTSPCRVTRPCSPYARETTPP